MFKFFLSNVVFLKEKEKAIDATPPQRYNQNFLKNFSMRKSSTMTTSEIISQKPDGDDAA